MGRSLKRLGWLAVLLFAAAHAGAAGLVLIDPGHGGDDPGVKAGKLHEADLCLALAKDLAATLGKAGLQARLTRDSDQSLSLSARVELADQLRPDVFISLHFNDAFQKEASGPRIFVPAEGKVDDRDAPRWEEAARVHAADSKALGEALAHALGLRGARPVQTLKLGLFRGLLVPVAMVETGFAGNAADLHAISDSNARRSLAQQLANGIQAYLSEAGHAAR